MNREQRRKLETKIMSKNNMTRDKAKQAIAFAEGCHRIDESKGFKDGDKVKLDVPMIMQHPDYKNYSDKYKDFVQANRDTIFTLEFEEDKKEKGVLACFKEDKTEPKWLFWTGNLIKVKEEEEDDKA